jgi:hypothetical protein
LTQVHCKLDGGLATMPVSGAEQAAITVAAQGIMPEREPDAVGIVKELLISRTLKGVGC